MTTRITTDNIADGSIENIDIKNGTIDITSKVTGSIPSANLGTIPVSKGGTGLTSLGSAGQAVKVNSSGNALEFGSVDGGLVLLSATNVSSASSIDFNSSLITSTYKVYEIIGNLFYATAANGTGTIRYSTDNGSTMNSASNVHYATFTTHTATANYRASHTGTEFSMVGVHVISQSNTIPITFRLTIFNPMGTEFTGIESKASYYNGTGYGQNQSAGHIATNTAINFIRIISTNGNFASGFVNLYGRKSS